MQWLRLLPMISVPGDLLPMIPCTVCVLFQISVFTSLLPLLREVTHSTVSISYEHVPDAPKPAPEGLSWHSMVPVVNQRGFK